MRCLFLAVAITVAPLSASSVQAQSGGLSETGFSAYAQQLGAQAIAAGVSRATVDRVVPTLRFNRRAVELDRANAPSSGGSSSVAPFEPYRRQHVTPRLIERGAGHYSANRGRLNEIYRRYGVTPSVLVAIWGHETSYGTVTGNFDLLDSLASLAYEGRRRSLFAGEFIATLKLLERGIPRSQLRGSWAGATGHPQFLPSMYLRLGADGDGDGRANIWSSQIDALASIANYLRSAGWKPNVPWGVRVLVPPSLNRNAIATRLRSPRCPRVFERHSRWMTIREWRQLGLVSPNGVWPRDEEMASLLEPDGRGAPGYLLTTNYRSILDYNCSNFYALSVGLLADAIAR
jgi:membrane-bound lytic murein transglycosylase B